MSLHGPVEIPTGADDADPKADEQSAVVSRKKLPVDIRWDTRSFGHVQILQEEYLLPERRSRANPLGFRQRDLSRCASVAYRGRCRRPNAYSVDFHSRTRGLLQSRRSCRSARSSTPHGSRDMARKLLFLA
ncbi:hypothetical protein AB1N83_001956 [Pleurotus pulmonarius]